MSNSWLPPELCVAWIMGFCVLLALQIRHFARLDWWANIWHGAHALMALGMIDMFWPSGMPVGTQAGEVVFGAGLLCTFGLLGLELAREAADTSLWLFTAVDLAGMLYMFHAMTAPAALLTSTFVAWYGIGALAWGGGYLSTSGLRGAEPEEDDSEGGALAVRSRVKPAVVSRIAPVLMNGGMVYMLLALQFGTASGATHPRMPGM